MDVVARVAVSRIVPAKRVRHQASLRPVVVAARAVADAAARPVAKVPIPRQVAAGMLQALGPLRDALGDDIAALGLGFGGGGGGRGGANVLMNTGDYRITLVAGGTTMSRVLRIVRVSGGDGGGGFGFGLDDDDRPLPGARR